MFLTDARRLIAYRMASDLIAKGAFLVLMMLAARRLAPEAFGLLALGTTLGWMIGVLTDGGLHVHVARTVARAAPEEAGAVLQRWIVWRVLTAVVALALAGLGVGALVSTWSDRLAVVLLVAAYLCSGVTEFLYHVFRGLSRTDLESTIAAVSRLLTLLAAGLLLMIRPSLLGVATAILVVAAVTALTTWAMARRIAPAGSLTRANAPRRRQEFLREAAPVGAALILSALYFRVDVLLLQHWQGAAAVGHYTAVFRLIEALRLFPAAALAIAFPLLCRAESTQPMRQLTTRLCATAVPLVVVVWAVADWIVPLCFGARFGRAVPAFRILLVAFPFMTANYALTTQLVAWRRHAAYAALCAVALVVNVWLNARLIPVLSLEGAAWATVWTEVWLTAGCLAVLGFAPGSREQRVPATGSAVTS